MTILTNTDQYWPILTNTDQFFMKGLNTNYLDSIQTVCIDLYWLLQYRPIQTLTILTNTDQYWPILTNTNQFFMKRLNTSNLYWIQTNCIQGSIQTNTNLVRHLAQSGLNQAPLRRWRVTTKTGATICSKKWTVNFWQLLKLKVNWSGHLHIFRIVQGVIARFFVMLVIIAIQCNIISWCNCVKIQFAMYSSVPNLAPARVKSIRFLKPSCAYAHSRSSAASHHFLAVPSLVPSPSGPWRPSALRGHWLQQQSNTVDVDVLHHLDQ
jgi:hypothetical protein